MGAVYPFENIPESQRPFGGWIPTCQALSPHPQIPTWSPIYSWGSPLGFNTYNALQTRFEKRMSKGLWFQVGYTWAKTIDNVNSAFGDTWGQNSGRPFDYYNLAREKSISDFDQRHTFKIGGAYELPFGRGKPSLGGVGKALNALVGGWTIQYIGNYYSGEPLGFSATGTPNFRQAVNRAVIMNPNGESLMAGFNDRSLDMSNISTPGFSGHKYVNTALVRDPKRYERGNASRRHDSLRQDWLLNEDWGVQKNFAVREGWRAQLRLDLLNGFNRHRIGGSINLNAASPLFGQVTGVSNDRREIQFGARLDF